MKKEQVVAWLTEERMARINHHRERAGKESMTREEIEELLLYFSERDMRELTEALG